MHFSSERKSSDSSKSKQQQHDYEIVEVPEPVVVYFETKTDRQVFVRKVFAILLVMLTVVTLMGSSVLFIRPLRDFLNDHWWISFLAWIPFLIIYFLLVCVPSIRKRHPINIIMLILLTLSMGLVIMGSCAHTQPEIVILTFAVTTVTCLAIIVMASSKFCCDITSWGFILFAALFAAIIFSICATIVGLFYEIQILNTIICGIFCLIFMGFLAFDTQQIVGGRRHQLRPDEYVLGALQLFLDIVMIFMYMLGMARG